jgi:hypothetical protein
MLPLAAPLCLPAGILGKPSLGKSSLKELVADAYGKKRDHRKLVDWLDHPMVTAWLTVATMYHREMAIEVMGRRAIADSLRPQPDVMSPYDVYFADTLVADYWKVSELTLAFRYFVNFVVGRDRSSATSRLFHKYLEKVVQCGLYDESNILGSRSWEVAYEALILRPPKSGPWKSGRWNAFVAGSQWNLNSQRCPEFLRDYIVEEFDPSKCERMPLKRRDGSKDPVFSVAPDEPEGGGPTGSPFLSSDQRICNTDNDCGEFEQHQERLLMDRLQKSMVESVPDEDDLFPELVVGDPTIAAELKSWRLRPLSERHIARPVKPQLPAPAVPKRPAGVNPFRFLLETAQKQKKLTGDGVPNTPPRDAPVHGSGINPWNVLRPVLPPVQAQRIEGHQEEQLMVDRDTLDDGDEDGSGPVSQGSAVPAIKSLLSRFASPPGESAHTAIPVDVVTTRATPIAQLRRSQPVTDKMGEPFVLRQRSLVFGDEAPASSQSSNGAAVPQAALWSLRDDDTGYPPLFTFWSLLLMFRDPTFSGRFFGGSHNQRPVDSDWRTFPAVIPTKVCVQFFLSDNKLFHDWVQHCVTRARREASLSHSARLGWLQPGRYLHKVTKDLLHQLRSGGLWSCASYFEFTMEPSKSNFTVFSMLTTRSPNASNLLPAEGLQYSECLDVLRNTLFLLSLPVTQGELQQDPAILEAIVENTLLLGTLKRLLDKLCDDPRAFHAVSVRSYWETRCDAAARNNLAYIVLAYVDELLSMFSAHITDPTPSLRLVQEPDDDDNIYLAVDPTVRNSLLVNNAAVLAAPGCLWHSALWMWEAAVTDKLISYVRGEPSAIPPAPAPYVEQSRTASVHSNNPKGKSHGTPPHRGKSNQDKVRVRVAIPILRWGPRAPPNAATTPSVLQELVLQKNKPHPRFPAPANADQTGRLICFAFTMAGHEGCSRTGCQFEHIDGQSLTQTGTDAFSSLSRYLDTPNIKDVIVYTDTGRINSGTD